MLNTDEFSEISFDKIKNKYFFNEQLYPESRGWICHEYNSYEEAQLFREKKIKSSNL